MDKIKVTLVFVLLSLLFVNACNSDSEGTGITPTSTPIPTVTVISTPVSTPEPTPVPNQSAPNALPTIADVVELVEPSVVYISVEYLESSLFFRSIQTKSGSGVILSPDGYILTNNHVVEDARDIKVVLPDNDNTYGASTIGTDPLSDLAVIKIEGHNFPTVEFADTSKLRIGDWVIAIGNALGLEGGPSVTVGIVSNLDRSLALGESRFYDVIQTDAAINPGNSGGPLVDLEGRVVGINTFIITTAQNIGFSVNASTAQRVYEDLVNLGHVRRPYLGVTLQTVTPALATEMDLSRDRGVLVTFVEPDSPSDQAGLKTEDVITRLQDQIVTEASELIKLLWQYNVGDSVKVTFWRGDEQQEVWITLTERP
jgi:S1-C subfamily serine protease